MMYILPVSGLSSHHVYLLVCYVNIPM
jgi:hypothetical protein